MPPESKNAGREGQSKVIIIVLEGIFFYINMYWYRYILLYRFRFIDIFKKFELYI